MQTIDEKITAIIKRFHLNNYAFSKQIGVTGTTIDSILNGRPQKDGSRKKTKPGYDVLLAIINGFDINPDFLFGKSDIMLQSEIEMIPSNSKTPEPDSIITQAEEHVVYIPVQARADYWQKHGDIDYIKSLRSFKMPFLTKETFRCFEVQGNSMAQTFYDGDFVFGTSIKGVSEIRNNEVYVLVSKTNGVILKRVLKSTKQPHKLVLKSDNKDGNFPDLMLDSEDIMEIWKVIMYVSKQIAQPMNIFETLHELEKKIMNLESKIQ